MLCDFQGWAIKAHVTSAYVSWCLGTFALWMFPVGCSVSELGGHTLRSPIHMERPHVGSLANSPSWAQPLSYPSSNARQVNKKVPRGLQPLDSSWLSHLQAFEFYQLKFQTLWGRDKPSFPVLSEFLTHILCEHNKMIIALHHHIWDGLVCSSKQLEHLACLLGILIAWSEYHQRLDW